VQSAGTNPKSITKIKMDFVLELENQLTSSSLEECQVVLDNPQDLTSQDNVLNLEKEFLENALAKFKRCIKQPIIKDVQVINGLKRLSSHSIATVIQGEDADGMCGFSRLPIVLYCLTLFFFYFVQ
jgi:hypothetical protein